MELSEQITQSDPDNTPDAESTGSDKVIIKFNLRGTPQGHNNCPGNPQINTQQGGGGESLGHSVSLYTYTT